MNGISILCGDIEKARALARYLKLVMGVRDISINPFTDPYRQKEAYDLANECGLIIADAFINGNPKGFQFAKSMEKRTLLLFSPGEMTVETDGDFWQVLPHGLTMLQEKIKKVLSLPGPSRKDFEALEKKFPILKESEEHVHY